MSKVAEIKNDFNTKARTLGSRARIGGNTKKIELQEYLYTDSKGYEIIQKATIHRFSQLIENYPSLQD